MPAPVLVRLLSSPPLSMTLIDDVKRRFAGSGELLHTAQDGDLDLSVLTLQADLQNLNPMLAQVFQKIGVGQAVGRAFRLDLQTESSTTLSEESLRGIAVDAHGALHAPVYLAHRSVPVGAWQQLRPMGWSRNGLAHPKDAPMLPYSPSESVGLAIETGSPTILFTCHLNGMGERHAQCVLDAVSAPDAGFQDVAVSLVVAERTGGCFAVLEFGDPKRSPPARVLKLMEIEARRYGGALGAGMALSHVPLETVLATLASAIGLHAVAGQVIETHLSAPLGSA
ncbi:MAG: hypothetical protein M3Z37_03845 [Candidatus Eremiobacteraeota bacterium]|nr:hypothetical protein [Candidatus Eremiobacteraeota bacterium]